jgi:hypothetical protein
MAKLITVSRAEKEIKRLQHYIELAESYEADTLEKWVIKEYAVTNSLVEVIKRANEKGYSNNGKPIDKPYVVSIVNGKALDELHRLLKSGYNHKIKPSKTIKK